MASKLYTPGLAKRHKFWPCPNGRKRGFATKEDALDVLARARKTGRRECRVYLCPACQRWHLTSH